VLCRRHNNGDLYLERLPWRRPLLHRHVSSASKIAFSLYPKAFTDFTRCADLETEVARNTNHHDDTGDYTCNGGLQSYCCADFSAPPTKSQLAAKAAAQAASDAAQIAEEVAEAAAEQAALDLAAKAFCRVAVPALLAPLELLEDLIPIIGEFQKFFLI
jgi:hypothetical protein